MTSVVAAARDAVECVLDFPLGVAVERGSRLVEQQDRRALEDRARAIATRCFSPAGEFSGPRLTHFGLVAVRRHADEAVDLRKARGILPTSASLASQRP